MIPTLNLGPRLKTVASFVPQDAYLGDIGTDHAYLPIFLYEQGIIKRAIAVEVHKGPYLLAFNAVRQRKLENVIDVRFGDGLQPIEPGEVDVLTIAGMGGKTMLEILQLRPDVLAKVHTLVLQPQGAEVLVRKTLLAAGWRLAEETLIEEEGRIYVVMVYSRTAGFSLSELLYQEELWCQRLEKILSNQSGDNFREITKSLVRKFGPLILEKGGTLLDRLLEEYNGQINSRVRQMQASNKPEVQEKIKELNFIRNVVEGMRKWLAQSL